MTRRLPQGQEETVLVLARDMWRNVVVVSLVTTVVVVAGAGLAVGLAGAVSALVGAVLGVLSSLFTLVLMRRTADRLPQAVMVASFGGLLTKMIFLLAVLFLLGTVDGVHRLSLAAGLLAVLITATAAEGWAGYRLRTMYVVPDDPATSGSVTGLSGSPTGASADEEAPAVAAPPRPDREQ
ncbi:ATP synthase subunit I [Pseudonocardia hydrocarbonoxydans]|uniref:ATP synthase protein I n=1 Tax=Pseudonocardia hydrocarbonoxydans TaxID=76726 RepID=A0A4Y3WML6_9PSEU|nr:ATP synthase subunit I [Pseudonocardia hydrocarbonoxydans]GEC19310.1 hypothetical protein PHY01_15930 [Pseudonocardia hydrocarbonoxydans]